MKNKMINILRLVFSLILFQISNLFCHDGIDYYYGIGVEKNYTKAIELFKKDNSETSKLFLILIYINGEGVKANPKKALYLLNKLADGVGEYTNRMIELRKLIYERIANPKNNLPNINYCDLAMTTIDLNECGNINIRIEKDKLNKKILKLSDKFNSYQKAIIDSINKEFEVMVEYDSERIYLQYISGTIRGIASSEMERYLIKHHSNRIDDFLVEDKIVSDNITGLSVLENNLKEEVENQRIIITNDFEENVSHYLDEFNTKEYYQDIFNNTIKNLDKSHIAWKKYCENWILLIKSIYNKENVEDSIRIMLIKERIEEIKYDPLEGDE